jgi:ribosomal protein S18 acetylase RimI-like enzyme
MQQRRQQSLLIALVLLLFIFSVGGFEFRPATKNDVAIAQKILFQEKMNPLSLSKEYMLVAVDERSNAMIGFGQIRPLDETHAELASLFVDPKYRRQGIGGKLVDALMERHNSGVYNNKEQMRQKVCLLTLKPTIPFYELHGFRPATKRERESLPNSLKLELVAGSVVSLVLGNEIVCMVEKTEVGY